MKTRNRITKLITLTMAVVALAAAGLLCGTGWLQPVEAQHGDGSVRFVSYAAIGMVPGEMVRLSVGNAAAPLGGTVVWTYKVTNTGGVPLYESGRLQVAPGEVGSSDVSHEDLNTEGERGTERALVMVRVTIEAPAGSNSKDFPLSAEVIKKETGANSEWIRLHEYGHGMDVVPKQAFIGFIPGERLSFSVFNPPEAAGAPVRAQAYIYDATGRLITRSAEVELRSEQVQTFTFDRDDLPLAGEERTRRLQVRAAIQVKLMGGSVLPVEFPVWTEIENSRTGGIPPGGDYYTGSVTVSDD